MKKNYTFRLEPEAWEKFNDIVRGWSSCSKEIRGFILWFNKYHNLWPKTKYFYDRFPKCFICRKEMNTQESWLVDKEQIGRSAIANGFKVMLVISKGYYQEFETETFWVCGDCHTKIKNLRL
jgi:hypothetical protein